ncbi:MAG: methyltransferase domain-containing protein [Chloroflexota bacterium]
MDEVARYNIERWETLVQANALFTRPKLELDTESAREWLDSDGMFGDLHDKDVLLLAGGGGQQSAAFALLGARVTAFDLSEGQLARDQQVAAHYGLTIATQQGDMRDLSVFADNTFDLVYQPYSLNFVPDARVVFAQVARVLRPGGIYYFMCANPFAAGLTEGTWNGEGYTLKNPYEQGAKIIYEDPDWVYKRDNVDKSIPGPQEFRQTLSTLLNGLLQQHFKLLRLEEVGAVEANIQAEPGTWDHFTAIIPPWLAFWTTKESAH